MHSVLCSVTCLISAPVSKYLTDCHVQISTSWYVVLTVIKTNYNLESTAQNANSFEEYILSTMNLPSDTIGRTIVYALLKRSQRRFTLPTRPLMPVTRPDIMGNKCHVPWRKSHRWFPSPLYPVIAVGRNLTLSLATYIEHAVWKMICKWFLPTYWQEDSIRKN